MASESAHTVAEPHDEGVRALAAGEWEVARSCFEREVAERPSAGAYELLSWACWWTSDGDALITAREAAFRAYREAGDRGGAGRMAAWLSCDVRDFRGEDAVGQGWLRRAQRMLEGVEESADHGWLAQLEANYRLNVDGDLQAVIGLAREGARIGREQGVLDLESVGLAQEGIALVLRGDIAEGMRCLDEASVLAADERHHLAISPGWAVCCMLTACDGIGDFPRAAEFCEVMRRFAERWKTRHFTGLCRTSYGEVLAARGDWASADTELTAAVADMVAVRPTMAVPGQIRLGRLRARQGRMDEARELFQSAGPAGVLGRGELALDAGDAAAAIEAADRALRQLPDAVVLERVLPLELLARARGAAGDAAGASAAAAELTRVCTMLGTPYLCALARRCTGEVALATGDFEEARRAAEDATDSFLQVGAPYEAARARLVLARALAAGGRREAADREARAAGETFTTLGAQRDVERVGELLTAPPTAPPASSDELSPRELEVLRLIAEGLSDAQVAQRLHLSPHTVHRHVANIRTKLRLPSRAAAVAYASRSDLL